LLATSCRKPVQAVLGTPVVLPVNHAATFRGSDVDLYFRRVASDSRCPTGAQCVAAGDAVVTVEVRILKSAPDTFEVRLPEGEAPDSAIWKPYEGYRIRLMQLDPHPATGQTIDSTTYVGTFMVEKR
jgi:hypothetical protein